METGTQLHLVAAQAYVPQQVLVHSCPLPRRHRQQQHPRQQPCLRQKRRLWRASLPPQHLHCHPHRPPCLQCQETPNGLVIDNDLNANICACQCDKILSDLDLLWESQSRNCILRQRRTVLANAILRWRQCSVGRGSGIAGGGAGSDWRGGRRRGGSVLVIAPVL